MIDENMIVQIFLVLGTIAMVIVSWIKMSESNNLVKKELEVKIRPILARTIIGTSNLKTTTGIIHEPVFSLQPNKVLFHFTNNGMLPAVNIIQRYYIRLKRLDKWNLIKTSDEISVNGINLPTMSPNEKYSVDICYELQHYKEALAFDTCYFGLILEYYDPALMNKYTYKMEGHFDKQYLMLDNVEAT